MVRESTASTGPPRLRALAGVCGRVGLVVAAAALVLVVVVEGYRSDDLAVDLVDSYIPAAEAVIDGRSPFVEPDDALVRARTAYAYPPLVAIALAPVSGAPRTAVAVAGAAIMVGLVVAALLLVGVRDWRCYAVAFTWAPVLAAVQTANVTLVLAVAAALAWRFRDRPLPAGVATGASLGVKPLLWPLGVWLLATGRARAAAFGALVGVVAIVGPWAAIGFAGLGSYRELVRALSRWQEEDAYTVFALARDVGAGQDLARVLWALVLLAALAAAFVLGRRGRDGESFMLAIVAALAATPLVWLHYFALLIVPLGVLRPRLSPAWALPLVFWAAPGQGNGSTWQTAAALAAVVLVLIAVCRRPASAPQVA